jgi:hypothetical protein
MNRRYNSAVGNAFPWSSTALHQLLTFFLHCGTLCGHLAEPEKKKERKQNKERMQRADGPTTEERAGVVGLNQASLLCWVSLVHLSMGYFDTSKVNDHL